MIGTLFGTFNPDEVYTRSFSFESIAQKPATIDIHTGGEDHIDVHHKNEILQSEALGFIYQNTGYITNLSS